MKRKPLFLLIIVSLLVYANTFNNGYVLDDLAAIKDNRYVAKGLKGIPTLLTTPYLRGFRIDHDATTANDLYRPVSLVLFAVERQIWGDWPAGSHLINILLFAGCVALLFLFLDALFDGGQREVAFIAALLYAVHPVHTEVVANIKSADELLCFFFAFCSLNIFARYASSGRLYRLIGGVICLLISLLAKETSVSFILIVPLIFFFYRNENKKRSIQITIAAVAITILYLFIRHAVLHANHAESTGAVSLLDNALTGAPSLFSRIATAIMLMGYYIWLLFIPYPLVCDYSYNTVPIVGFGSPWVLLSLAIYAALCCFGIARLIKKKKDPYAFAILFFLITIALFSNIVLLIGSTFAERFLFFPSVGFCFILASFLWRWVGRMDGAGLIIGISKKKWIAIIPVCAVLTFLTIQRNAEWKDNYTLFKADVAKSPNNARLLQSLGYEETTTGVAEEEDPKVKDQLMQEGIAHLYRSLEVYPGNSGAHNYLGNLYGRLKRFDSAEAQLKQGISLDPKNPVALCDLGGIYFVQQQYAKSVAICKRALLISPANAIIMNNLAMGYTQMRIFDSAIYYYQKALTADPGNAMATANIAAVRSAMQQADTP